MTETEENAWKVSKYGPEKTRYLDTFHEVRTVKTVRTGTNYKSKFTKISLPHIGSSPQVWLFFETFVQTLNHNSSTSIV